MTWQYQPMLFPDEDIERYEEYVYTHTPNEENIVYGDTAKIAQFIENARSAGYKGGFTVWTFEKLTREWYHSKRGLVSRLTKPQGLIEAMHRAYNEED